MKFFISAPFMIVGFAPARSQDPADHAGVVDLPLVPATPTLRSARVEQLGQQLGAGDDSGTEAPRGLHVRNGLLDRGGDDQDLAVAGECRCRPADAAYAARAQEIEPFGVAALVERAVRALDPSAARLDDQRQRASCRCRRRRRRSSLLVTLAEPISIADAGQLDRGARMSRAAMQDRRRRPRLAPVAGGRRESAGAGRAPLSGRTPRSSSTRSALRRTAISPATTRRARGPFSRSPTIEGFDAVWFARGGYGSCRMVEAVMPGLTGRPGARPISATAMPACCSPLSTARASSLAHGPMAQDILRDGGEAAVARALAWLVDRDPAALEPTVAARRSGGV